MNNILIIGAGVFQLPLVIEASKQYDVLLAAPSIDKRFDPYIAKKLITDVRDKELILKFAIENNIVGVITDQTDIAVRSVAYVAEKMHLPGIGYETGCLFTDKSLMRKRMLELGIKLLPNKTVSSLEEALDFYNSIGGMVILKPLDTQGSRGVSKCINAEDIKFKYEEAAKWSSNRKVIIEKYATGREFVVEGMAVDYSFKNLNFGDTDYFNLPDAFAAKTRIFPSTADDHLKKRVYELNEKIIKGFRLKQGITHSEFIMEGDDIYLIETAARGGGVFISSDLIHYSTGLNTEEFLLGIATGRISELPNVEDNLQACGYMAFYIPNGIIVKVDGLETVNNLEYVHRNQLDEIFIGKRISGGQNDKTTRLAIIVSGDTRAQVVDRMNYIRSVLKVIIETDDGLQGLIWE